MKITLVSEKIPALPLVEQFRDLFLQESEKQAATIEEIRLALGDVTYCIGCMQCWMNSSPDCMHNDGLPELEKLLPGSDFILYLTTVKFGTFSPVIKTLVDKGFGTKLFGNLLFPQVFVGFGENLSGEERRCFTDIVNKHMGYADIVHPELSGQRNDAFVSCSPVENREVFEHIRQIYPFQPS